MWDAASDILQTTSKVKYHFIPSAWLR